MAPTRFSIVLDNPVGAYFPGQTITGKVILVLDQEKNSQGLKLKLNGEAEVKWQEGIQGQSGSKGFHEKESYFHTKIVLLGDERATTDISIPAGHHEYPFSFELPLSLPSSFESPFGHVRYDIEAVVKRSWKFDYSTKLMFTVNALVDLNLRAPLAEPREVTKEKSICCLCCKEGPISMRIEMPRTGYVPGDVIKFSVASENSSSRPIAAIVVYFIREIYYRAQGRAKSVQEEIVKKRGPEVQPFLSESWAEEIHIPPVPPSDLGGCKIIEIVYMLKVTACIINTNIQSMRSCI
ncbi:unnamed protein product [Orchesella dallaii]|uniref:Arrestin C-terminal-like domain-containing protein n=1 Tax=Orchesella dallaii TaxID=48710 RepID=A0ABP1Q5P9_9HEXA